MATAKNGKGLSLGEIAQHVTISGKWMIDTNGEYRFRTELLDSGLSVSITTTQDGGAGFQNCHRHLSNMIETYAIHEGWVVLAEQTINKVVFKKFVVGEHFTISSLNPHGLYVGRRTSFATIKYGSREGRKDWEPTPELDKYFKDLGIKRILTMLEK